MQSSSTAPSWEQFIRPLWNILPTLLKSSIIDTKLVIRLREATLFAPTLDKLQGVYCLYINCYIWKPTFPWGVNKSWWISSAGNSVTVGFLFPEFVIWQEKRERVSRQVCPNVHQTWGGPWVFVWCCPQNLHHSCSWRMEIFPCQTSKVQWSFDENQNQTYL